MLVLALLGVVLSLFAANIGANPYRQLEKEAQRLQLLLADASDEAIMQGLELAVSFPDDGYEFVTLDQQTGLWAPVDEHPYNYHPLPDNVRLELSLNNQLMSDVERKQLNRLTKQGELRAPPAILLLSSGEISPFALEFTLDGLNESITLITDGFSEIQLRR